jgi:hypothetical protein
MANYMNLPIIVISSLGFNDFAQRVREKLGREPSLFSKRITASASVIALLAAAQLADLGMFLNGSAARDNRNSPEAEAASLLERPSFESPQPDAYWSRIGPVSKLLAFRNDSENQNQNWQDADRLDFDPKLNPSGRPRKRLLEHTMDLMKVETESPTPSRLLWQMNFDQYWKAYVDEKPAAIEETQNGRMALDIPEGRHVVLWIYEPITQKILIHANLLCSGIAAALLVCVI